jgi:EVE domain
VNVRVDDDEPGRWLWVTGPRYYAEDDGSDRVDLDPTGDHVADGWWTCHKDTREGDLVLLYRTKPKMDIAYLIETRSDAYSLLQDPSAEPGWDYGCDYEVIEKFAKPLGIAEIKADPELESWNAKNSRFQRRAFRIERGIWDHLIARLVADPTQTERKLTRIKRLHTLEAEIEAKLESEPERLSVLGDLRRVDRQHRCLNGGRADLVFTDKRSKRYVVVELKRGLVGRSAVAQALSYRASVGAEFHVGGELLLGVVVGERLDNEAAGMIEDDDRLQFVSLSDLGFG